MNARLGLILATAALMTGYGCAGTGGAPEPSPSSPTPPSGQGQILEEGIRPRDNEFTRAAESALDQALAATEEAEQRPAFEMALQSALDGIAADPQNPKSYFQAGIANVSLGNYVAADSMFAKAEELHPRYVLETGAWRERGWVSAYNEAIVPMNEGDLEEARRLFEAANALYSERPEALLQLGSVYSRLGRNEQSADAFRSAMEILEESKETALMDTATAPTWEQHWDIATTGLGQALQLSGQFQEAADLYSQLLAERPEDPTLIGNLASVLTELEMPDSVDALYDNLLNRPGLTEQDYFNAGVGLYRIEEYERAAEAFTNAAEMNPFSRDARLNLTQTHYQAQDWEALIPAARELLEMDPLNGLVWVFLTRAYSELERTEEANEVFNEYQAIGYEIENLNLQGLPTGGALVTGTMKNNSAEPGTTVTLRFHFGGPDGQEVGTTDVRVQLPAVEESVEFTGEFPTSEAISGYRYEVVD